MKRKTQVHQATVRAPTRPEAPNPAQNSEAVRQAVLLSVATLLDKRPRTKVILRRLPASIAPEDFLNALDDVCNSIPSSAAEQMRQSVLWMQLVPGKKRDGKLQSSSVAYIEFSSRVTALAFITAFQGHTFVAAHGVQYKSSCGLAPSQRVMIPPESQPGHKLFANKNAHEKLDAAAYYRANPEELVKTCIPTPDRKMGTIETDASYLAFVKKCTQPKSAEQPRAMAETRELVTAESDNATEKVSPVVRAAMNRRITKLQRQNSKARNISEISNRRTSVVASPDASRRGQEKSGKGARLENADRTTSGHRSVQRRPKGGHNTQRRFKSVELAATSATTEPVSRRNPSAKEVDQKER